MMNLSIWKRGDPIPEGHGEIGTTEDGIYWLCKCGWKGRFLTDLEDHYTEARDAILKREKQETGDRGVITQT